MSLGVKINGYAAICARLGARVSAGSGPRRTLALLTPVSGIRGLPHLGALLPLDELLRLREPQKWILRPIWGLGGHA